MYTVDNQSFDSYFAAIAAAKAANTQVIQSDNGQVRWEPLPEVSAKRMRRYKEQNAAYQVAKRAGQAK